MIKVITRCSWSHAALYIGRLYDIADKGRQKRITEFYSGDPNEQLVFESLLGKGALISPLKKYEKEHSRICRPRNISHQKGQKIINYAIKRLSIQYDSRLIFDLGRF
ncbi:YiiX/YebB-like N1pC/P60 family cysteine hydrolase [Rickettsiella endosymbiont of Xylota segnis]|uniref:YiiX/YebB-like N1pC/P60 family cysteine hydrolase n=1 Tax=Rickettsiella endosymbiont of Xylota segnis TaxID=3066238 RepID=UPI0030D05393